MTAQDLTGTAVGTELPPRVVGPVTLTDIVRFAGACGDFNPIHHDETAARASGFRAPVAMGQMTAGMAGAWIADWCGIERLRHLEVRFAAPVCVGDVVTFSGSITDVETDGDQLVAHLEFSAANGSSVVVRGNASTAFSKRR